MNPGARGEALHLSTGERDPAHVLVVGAFLVVAGGEPDVAVVDPLDGVHGPGAARELSQRLALEVVSYDPQPRQDRLVVRLLGRFGPAAGSPDVAAVRVRFDCHGAVAFMATTTCR